MTNEVIIVGSGAGGGTLAYELCKRGVKVTLLEAGPHIDPEEYCNDEFFSFDQLSWLDPRISKGGWRVAKDHPRFPVWHCKVVGGTTTHWSGMCLRMSEQELRPKTYYGDVAGGSFIDWPIASEEFDHYYTLAEEKLGVSGINGRPASAMNNNCKVMTHGARQLGLSRISTGRMAINSAPFDDRPGTIQDGFSLTGDKSGARWSTLNVEIPRALATGNLTLMPDSRVVELEHNAQGRVSQVTYVDAAGQRKSIAGDTIVLAGNCIETTRLLLASQSGTFPNGIGNNADNVGRYYQRHVVQTLWSEFDFDVYMNRGDTMAGLVEDFLDHDPERGYVGGYYLETNAMALPSFAQLVEPGWWGHDFVRLMEAYPRIAGLYMTGEDIPQASNRIYLSDEIDAYGVPVAVVDYTEHANDIAMRIDGYKRMTQVHAAAGALRSIETTPYPATHNICSNRMAESDLDGVVDVSGKVFGTENLYIADGSSFATGGAGNPTLTIVAMAIRMANTLTSVQ